MKAPNPVNPQKNSKSASSKINSFQKFIIFLGLMLIGFTILPVVVVLFIGLLPTLTAVVTDTKNINKITTIGCLNISGLTICLHDIYMQLVSSNFAIRENIANIIMMLSAAALGAFLYYVLPDLFSFIFKNSAQHRLKMINAKLARYAENWSNIIPEDQK